MNNTFGEYLGTHFQIKLFWQILTDIEFAEKILNFLDVNYFDDINYKRLYLIISRYKKEHEISPSLKNKSIYEAIKKYNNSNSVEEEILLEVLKQIEYWEESVINNNRPYDGDVVQREAFVFIKQQEYRQVSEVILNKVRSGAIKNKNSLFEIEENFRKISSIGDEEDYGVDLTKNIDTVFESSFRVGIPTGIKGIDDVTGGLASGEVGIILAASGVGKTTILSKIANTGLEEEKNVLQIIFEDTEDEVRRKHFTIWSKIPLSDLEKRKDEAKVLVQNKIRKINNRLIIKKFDENETTLIDIKNWIINFHKKYGVKFDMIVLDYLGCVLPHVTTTDQNQAELAIMKMLISLASKFDVPIWTALQGNRNSFNSELIDHTHMGGSITRAQKSHFLMSISRTQEQKRLGVANMQILKARFASDGHVFKDCIFNNNTMEIRVIDDMPLSKRLQMSNIEPEDLVKKIDDIENKRNNEVFNLDEIDKLLNGDKKDDKEEGGREALF